MSTSSPMDVSIYGVTKLTRERNELAVKLAEAQAENAKLRAENETLSERIENASMSASETQPSWKHRCHRIMGALGLDYGDPDFEMPEELSKREQSEAQRDEIAAKLATAREALEPFANAISRLEDYEQDFAEWPLFAEWADGSLHELLDGEEGPRLTIDNLRRARAALNDITPRPADK